ncbi:MAG: ABC-2 family transporter protein [Clostridia bacterium]|nr:ABC-2 family transporter protein [Clostridia bacterium]
MKKYLSFFKIRFIAGLQYRAAAWAGISTQFAWGGMNILMFRAFYEEGSNLFPMPFDSLSTYIWLQQAFLALFMAWFFDTEIFDSIVSGSIAYELCRPIDIYNMWFTKNTAVRLAKAALRCLPILVFAAVLPSPYGMSLPVSIGAFALFLLSMFLGFMVIVAFSMLVHATAFFTISPKGIRVLATSVIEFFSGGLIPIPFFPQSIQPFIYALPFASMQNTSFLIYTGYLSGVEALKGICLQAVWLFALWCAGKLIFRYALKRVVVQGG